MIPLLIANRYDAVFCSLISRLYLKTNHCVITGPCRCDNFTATLYILAISCYDYKETCEILFWYCTHAY